MGLNCIGPLLSDIFSVVNTVVLHDLMLVESKDAECGYRGIADMEHGL